MFDYGKVNEEEAANAYQALGQAFTWSATPEGNEFWDRIFSRLIDIASGRRPQTPLKLPSVEPASALQLLQTEFAETKAANVRLEADIKRLRQRLVAADFATMPRG